MRHTERANNPIVDYLKARMKIERTTFIITNNGNFYEDKGIRIPEKEFLSANPIPFLEAGKGYSSELDIRRKIS